MPRRNSKITKSLRRNTNPTTVTPQMKITLFPPTVTKDDFLGRPSTNLDTKSPNAFFVYRKAFVKHLSDRNLKFRMTEVSKLVSYNWKNESKEVKAAYTKIAQEIDKEFQERKRIIRGYKIVCDPIMTLDPDFLEPKDDERRESGEPLETTAINNSPLSSSTTSPIVKKEEESVGCHSPQSIATPESSTTESTIFDSDSGSEHAEQDFPLFEDMHREVFYNTEPFSPCLEQYEYQPNLEQFVQSDMNCVCYLPAEGQTMNPIWVDESSSCGYINDLGFFNTTFSVEQDPSLCQVENYGEYPTWNREFFY